MAIEVSQEQINSFVMPTPRPGEVVSWYPSGTRGRDYEVAHIFRIGARNVHLVTATKGVKEAVRHIDDPKLKLNADQREMGAWDFTEAAKEQNGRIESLEDDVKSIRKQLSALITASQKKKVQHTGHGLKKYQALRNKAIELGVEVNGNPSTSWLEEQIKAHEANGSG